MRTRFEERTRSGSEDRGAPGFRSLLAARPHLALTAVGLAVEAVPLARVAVSHGTPTWVYSAAAIHTRYRAMSVALAETGLDARIHYALKANDSLAVVTQLARQGAGADVVSDGERRIARQAGIAPRDIVFSGVGKTEAELRAALADGVGQINVESAEELAMLSAIARGMGVTAKVALRINPDVDAGTHAKITTGLAENKFGIPSTDALALYSHAAALPGIVPVGLAMHIGSQITSLAPFRSAYSLLAALAREVRSAGLPIALLDIGGGLGIPYAGEEVPSASAYAAMVKETLGALGLRLVVEPGRWIVGPAGVLLARVVLQKQGEHRRFVILDAAMNDLIRPSLYDAWHGILPVTPARWRAPLSPADVVGPVCETGDTFASARPLPDLGPGELVAILDAGAYGAVMSSTYNARPLAAAVMVSGTADAVIRPRQSFEAMRAGEVLPPWLGPLLPPPER
ncbi:diaminopimelate decarboxylase [Elioraea tepida]|uniref:Diaminopimelate decarboxylase n=1 Tax=Elioraea tepida TaxID=2843330 RepID=A0A975TZX0_9PROT|nr:diaminopimelate decarboxylase [Elioraea tepida]QXM23720.1 diaminopimelate decarboxylase [Elioraea tepida]